MSRLSSLILPALFLAVALIFAAVLLSSPALLWAGLAVGLPAKVALAVWLCRPAPPTVSALVALGDQIDPSDFEAAAAWHTLAERFGYPTD